MSVVFDANMLLLLLDPALPPPRDPRTGGLTVDSNKRITHLVNEIHRRRQKIIIPTPALCEVLVRVGSATNDYLGKLSRTAAFRIEPFDLRCAVEVAAMTASALAVGDKKSGSLAPWAKIKYDRQIVATARVAQATSIYTDDAEIQAFAALIGIPTCGVADLPLPPEDAQLPLPWDEMPGENGNTSDWPPPLSDSAGTGTEAESEEDRLS
jgi:hypothetical protein